MHVPSFGLNYLELDIRARIADARVLDTETLAALFIPHPFDLRRPSPLLQLGQRTKEDPDRMAAADCVLRSSEIFGEILVSLVGFRGRESQ